MNRILRESSIVKSIYGIDEIDPKAWHAYAKALLVVAGADGQVSDYEMAWLEHDFARIIQAPRAFKDEIRAFDYRSADLKSVLKEVAATFPINYLRALVYDSIKMSVADDVLHEKERDKARQLADILEVPVYIARTIEGLINTERSVGEIRKSIFEIDEVANKPNAGDIPASNAILMNALFGISRMPEGIHLTYGYALMTIAGADGDVSEAERNWYINEFAPAALVSPETIYRVMAFDFKKGDLKELIGKLQTDITINFSKTLLYHAIQMARADGEYAEEERLNVERTAEILEIPTDIAQTIQYLVDTEERIAKMRKTLFKAL